MERTNGIIKEVELFISDLDGQLTFGIVILGSDKKRFYLGGYQVVRCQIRLLQQLLETVGVERWDELIGQAVRIDFEETVCRLDTIGIGHIVDDKWFNLQEMVQKYFAPDTRPPKAG
jgi:hypothetical protein